MSTQQLDSDGVWRQAIPLPFYVRRMCMSFYMCECRRVFRTEQEYRAHYRAEHTDA